MTRTDCTTTPPEVGAPDAGADAGASGNGNGSATRASDTTISASVTTRDSRPRRPVAMRMSRICIDGVAPMATSESVMLMRGKIEAAAAPTRTGC